MEPLTLPLHIEYLALWQPQEEERGVVQGGAGFVFGLGVAAGMINAFECRGGPMDGQIYASPRGSKPGTRMCVAKLAEKLGESSQAIEGRYVLTVDHKVSLINGQPLLYWKWLGWG